MNCIIVIPIYREPKQSELVSLERCISVLSNYPIDLLHPKRYKVDHLIKKYSDRCTITETELDDKHFESVQSYSDLLLTEDFYIHYNAFDYMLIYQLDAYVFQDNLQEWVDKGYDYVGAPWIPRHYWWKSIFGMLKQRIRLKLPVKLNDIPHCFKYFSVGNGGFSLRNIHTIRKVVRDDKELIRQTHYFEDWYISQVASRTHDLRIPHWKEALQFSFEVSLYHSYRLNHYQLPFGCHYWQLPANYIFWKKYIPLEGNK